VKTQLRAAAISFCKTTRDRHLKDYG